MKFAFREIRFFAERELDLTEKFLKEMYRKLKLEQFDTCGRVFKTGSNIIYVVNIRGCRHKILYHS